MMKPIVSTVAVVLLAATFVTHAEADERRARTRHFDPVGHEVRRVPRGFVWVTVGPRRYRYYDGMFYRPLRPGFVVVGAPIGARVRTLPRGYVAFGIGPRSYFFVNSTYYLWEPRTREYVVVEEPAGAAQALDAASATGDEPGQIFAYPNEGQGADQSRRDRYECHLWAAEESGYDPTYSDPAVELAGDYRRAMEACLVGRGYTVR
jgi:hypothetical protein